LTRKQKQNKKIIADSAKNRTVITKELKTKTNLLKKYGLDNSLRGQS